MIDEHTKTLVNDDQPMSKILKLWYNNGQTKKTKSENGSAPTVTVDAITTTMTRIELDTMILEITF